MLAVVQVVTAAAAGTSRPCRERCCRGTERPLLLHRAGFDPAGMPNCRATDTGPGARALPHAFAQHPVFVAQAQLDRMAAVVQAMETVVALPAYREQALARTCQQSRATICWRHGRFHGLRLPCRR